MDIFWVRFLQGLLLLLCLLTTAATCYVGVMAWRRGESRSRQVRYVLLGGGLGLLFGVSLNAALLMERLVMQDVNDPSPARIWAQFLCCSAVPVFFFAAAIVQFLWLRKRWRR